MSFEESPAHQDIPTQHRDAFKRTTSQASQSDCPEALTDPNAHETVTRANRFVTTADSSASSELHIQRRTVHDVSAPSSIFFTQQEYSTPRAIGPDAISHATYCSEHDISDALSLNQQYTPSSTPPQKLKQLQFFAEAAAATLSKILLYEC